MASHYHSLRPSNGLVWATPPLITTHCLSHCTRVEPLWRQSAAIRVGDFDPDEAGDDLRGMLEGTCTVRVAKGRRSLFMDLTMEVPWRGVLDEGTDRERSLGGKTYTHHHGSNPRRPPAAPVHALRARFDRIESPPRSH